MRKIIPLFFLAVLLYSFLGCANQGVLTGGKKDTQPPVLDSLKSTPNYQTNFKKQTIELIFDEWLQLKDVFSQVVVTPPLQEKFDVSLKKKTVRFKFDDKEVLREDATYTINFGDAIQDLTERNPVKEMRFVFATGDVIDSLEVEGTVVDAFDKKPVKDVIVMLYDNLADTVVRKEKPFYFGKTNESGKFSIKNIRADTFKTFALIDGNANYLFDNSNEKIGFLNDPIVVTDSTKVNLSFQIFQEEAPLRLQGEDEKKYGRIAFGFNREPSEGEVQLNFQDVGQRTYIENKKDSLILWYDVPRDTTWRVYVATDTTSADTIKIPKLSRTKFFKDRKLSTAKKLNPQTKVVVNHGKPVSIEFKTPLGNVDTSFATLLVDTLLQSVVPQLEIDSTDRKKLLVRYPFKEKTPYKLQLFPGAVTDFYGLKNDTIIQNLDIRARNEFGDLTVDVVDLQEDKSYVLELLDKSDKLVEAIPISGDTIFQKIFRAIEPGKYSVRMIQDTNGNGRWDTGNYDNQSQPEPLFTRPLEEVRAGWEVEATVSADEKKAPPIPPPTEAEENQKPTGNRPRKN